MKAVTGFIVPLNLAILGTFIISWVISLHLPSPTCDKTYSLEKVMCIALVNALYVIGTLKLIFMKVQFCF